jgi:hypothetical protein
MQITTQADHLVNQSIVLVNQPVTRVIELSIDHTAAIYDLPPICLHKSSWLYGVDFLSFRQREILSKPHHVILGEPLRNADHGRVCCRRCCKTLQCRHHCVRLHAENVRAPCVTCRLHTLQRPAISKMMPRGQFQDHFDGRRASPTARHRKNRDRPWRTKRHQPPV